MATLIDTAAKNGPEIASLFAEAGNAAPELDFLDVKTIPNMSWKRKYRYANQGATSSNRDVGSGVAATKGSYGDEQVNCGTKTTYMEVENADLNDVGDEQAQVEYMASEQEGGADQFRQDLGSDIFYGTIAANKYAGLATICQHVKDVLSGQTIAAWATGQVYTEGKLLSNSNKLYRVASDHTSAAAIATDITAGKLVAVALTSVYLIWSGKTGRVDRSGVKVVLGGNGKIESSDFEKCDLTEWDDENEVMKYRPGFKAHIEAYPSISLGDRHSVIRYANITTLDDLTFSDAKVAEMLDELPSAIKKDKSNLRLIMSGRTRSQIRAARALSKSYNNQKDLQIGIENEVVESQGVKIIETDSIVDDENLYTA